MSPDIVNETFEHELEILRVYEIARWLRIFLVWKYNFWTLSEAKKFKNKHITVRIERITKGWISKWFSLLYICHGRGLLWFLAVSRGRFRRLEGHGFRVPKRWPILPTSVLRHVPAFHGVNLRKLSVCLFESLFWSLSKNFEVNIVQKLFFRGTYVCSSLFFAVLPLFPLNSTLLILQYLGSLTL